MASIQKYTLNNGEERWMYVIENGIDPQTGKRSRVVKRGFKKEREAIKAARDAEYELEKWKLDYTSKITFGELAQKWLDNYRAQTRKERSAEVYRVSLNVALKTFKHIPIKNINGIDYQDFLMSLKDKYAENTLIKIHASCKFVFKYAMELGIIHKSPAEFAKLPKKKVTVEEIENDNPQKEYLEKDELLLVLNVAKESKHGDDFIIFSMLAWTGLRIGELLALKWSDIDFENKTLSVTKTLEYISNNSKDLKVIPPKTTSSIRKLLLDDSLIELLLEHQKEQNRIKEIYEEKYQDENYVIARSWPPYLGFPYYPHRIKMRLENIINASGLKKHITPHTFRHTHTSLLAEAGVPLELIMDRLGHEDEKTTRNIYLHITQKRKEDAAQQFAKYLKNLMK